MPHAIYPDSSPGPDETMISQVNANAMEDQEMLDADDANDAGTTTSNKSIQEEDAGSQEKTQLEAMFDDDDDDDDDFPSSNEAPA